MIAGARSTEQSVDQDQEAFDAFITCMTYYSIYR